MKKIYSCDLKTPNGFCPIRLILVEAELRAEDLFGNQIAVLVGNRSFLRFGKGALIAEKVDGIWMLASGAPVDSSS